MSASTMLISSPVGPLVLQSDGSSLTGAHFAEETALSVNDSFPDAVVVEAAHQLAAYFAGELRDFDLPLAPSGTPFRQRVWAELRAIPFGATASYGDIAARLGIPVSASRAVGLANGANPIAIIQPCHRVIGSSGTLVGYAGGLHRKRFLLGLESPSVQDPLFDD